MEIIQYILGNLSNVILFTGLIIGVLLIVKWHISTDSRFDIKHLMIDSVSHKMSLQKVGQLFALLISTWVIIHETQYGRLTEFLFIGYMTIWSGSNSLNKWIDRNKPSEKTGN